MRLQFLLMSNVENIQKLIGRPVVSVETANALGDVEDLILDPLAGELAGFSVRRPDDSQVLASIIDVHDIGPDAIMVERDVSLVLAEASPLNTLPKAKANLLGASVLTEHGQSMGEISGLFLSAAAPYIFIYEVRSSIFDKLLGHAFYFSASLGCALSTDGTALVVKGDTETMDHSLESAGRRLFGPYNSPLGSPLGKSSGLTIEVRTRT